MVFHGGNSSAHSGCGRIVNGFDVIIGTVGTTVGEDTTADEDATVGFVRVDIGVFADDVPNISYR